MEYGITVMIVLLMLMLMAPRMRVSVPTHSRIVMRPVRASAPCEGPSGIVSRWSFAGSVSGTSLSSHLSMTRDLHRVQMHGVTTLMTNRSAAAPGGTKGTARHAVRHSTTRIKDRFCDRKSHGCVQF